jgi:hypothetical protein
MITELRDYLRGDDRIVPTLGAIGLWSVVFCGGLSKLI